MIHTILVADFSSFHLFGAMKLNLYLLILLLLKLSHFSSSMGPLCNEHDQVALLQFKNGFSLDHTNCPNSNPCFLSWVLHNETNSNAGCCSWEGVTCELSSGHVTGLDLSYCCLHGLFNATNSIFRISQLQHLNLSGNDFAQSQIPSSFGKFSMLSSLNLSQASFSGSIPQDILELSSLTLLDLSGNPLLQLPRHGLASIADNMKDLDGLSLSQINISSAVPATFANLTSLRLLELEDCRLQDHFPVEIFLLPKLESLNLMSNSDLYGHFPEFPAEITSLRSLELSYTNFHGEMPRSIGNLISLQILDAVYCNLSGTIPSTIGNLVNLTLLHLGSNQFPGLIPSSLKNLTFLKILSLSENPFSPSRINWIGKLTELKELYLGGNHLYGSIPSSLEKLKQIETLDLSSNHLSGKIPSWIGNLTRLEDLWLSENNLEGQIPSSIFTLKNLEALFLNSNKLSGTMDIRMFHEQKYMTILTLSGNHLSIVGQNFVNVSLPNFELLDLGDCNLREFPLFLKQQDMLSFLSLIGNNISGEIPAWFFNVSTKTMALLELSHNFLTRFEQSMDVLPWPKLKYIDLSFNDIHGLLPLSPSISVYDHSYNSLVGDLSPTICKAHSLSILDLSNNELGGVIPECFLGKLSISLQILNLKGNKFEGMIPQIETNNCSLRWINLSQNRLKGKLPRSMEKCRDLEVLDVGNNHITETFPSWLGTLPKLQVLNLKINNFHGPMGSPSSMADFPELRIIDLSSNSLIGALPSEYFPLLKAMKITTETNLTYVQVTLVWSFEFTNIAWTFSYGMNTEIRDKGMEREYWMLSNIMTSINLAGNKFTRVIPESIGDVVGLVGLDLSNNNLSGSIPSSLGELKQLESLDLSHNMLSGEIPKELIQLTFLGYLNVSYNNLSGRIPEGGQLGTFRNSFDGNPGLCGLPLPKSCGDANGPPVVAHEDQDPGTSDHTKLLLGFEGFATGLAIGLVIGYIITTRNHQWFVKTCLKLRFIKY